MSVPTRTLGRAGALTVSDLYYQHRVDADVPIVDTVGDFRRRAQPRFQGDNLEHNLQLLEVVKEVAAAYSSTPGQPS
jgi:aryl-alcohol dehydrogenase-like predicted oxidoreductase